MSNSESKFNQYSATGRMLEEGKTFDGTLDTSLHDQGIIYVHVPDEDFSIAVSTRQFEELSTSKNGMKVRIVIGSFGRIAKIEFI